jgi:hypothetical protein
MDRASGANIAESSALRTTAVLSVQKPQRVVRQAIATYLNADYAGTSNNAHDLIHHASIVNALPH